MPLGLPNHLAPRNVTRAYARGSHTMAMVCLIAAFTSVLAIQAANPLLTLWPAFLALVPMGINLFFLELRRSTFHACAYLLIGGACLYLYAVTGSFQYSAAARSDAFILVMFKLSLIFVGAGTSAISMVAWACGGFAVAELAVALGAGVSGGTYVPDAATIVTLACIVAAVVLITINRRFASNVQSSFTRAARDEHVSAVRYRIEAKAAAIMHDTVLGHLAAIATSPPGELSSELRAQITRDLEVLIGEEWLLDAEIPDSQSGLEWRESALFAAIEESTRLGLEVEVSGDVSAIGQLEREQAQAVALAAKQCLVNVIRHSGVMRAEVVVYGSDAEVSVMVIDAGKGFSESETGADRLGLRQSVRHRIEAVDGAVQVWSTPGRGTSVMIKVPARATDAAGHIEAKS